MVDNVSVNDEMPVEDQPAQSVEGAHTIGMHMCFPRDECACVFMNVCVFTVFLKNTNKVPKTIMMRPRLTSLIR